MRKTIMQKTVVTAASGNRYVCNLRIETVKHIAKSLMCKTESLHEVHHNRVMDGTVA